MRNFLRSSLRYLFAVSFIQLLLPYRSEAYIDPNTGGIFFTSVLPFVYAILAGIVLFWKRIVNVVKGIFSKKKEDDDK